MVTLGMLVCRCENNSGVGWCCIQTLCSDEPPVQNASFQFTPCFPCFLYTPVPNVFHGTFQKLHNVWQSTVMTPNEPAQTQRDLGGCHRSPPPPSSAKLSLLLLEDPQQVSSTLSYGGGPVHPLPQVTSCWDCEPLMNRAYFAALIAAVCDSASFRHSGDSSGCCLPPCTFRKKATSVVMRRAHIQSLIQSQSEVLLDTMPFQATQTHTYILRVKALGVREEKKKLQKAFWVSWGFDITCLKISDSGQKTMRTFPEMTAKSVKSS